MDMTAEDIVRRQRVSLGWDSKQLGAFDRLSIKLYYQDLDNSDDNVEYRTGNTRRLSDYGFQQSIYGATLDAEHEQQEHEARGDAHVPEAGEARQHRRVGEGVSEHLEGALDQHHGAGQRAVHRGRCPHPV